MEFYIYSAPLHDSSSELRDVLAPFYHLERWDSQVFTSLKGLATTSSHFKGLPKKIGRALTCLVLFFKQSPQPHFRPLLNRYKNTWICHNLCANFTFDFVTCLCCFFMQWIASCSTLKRLPLRTNVYIRAAFVVMFSEHSYATPLLCPSKMSTNWVW